MRKRPFIVEDCFADEDGMRHREAYAAMQKLHYIKNPYIGNKRKIIFSIWKICEEEGLEYDSVLDLFSGSAFVSYFYKLINKKVIANDILKSSYFNAVSLIENDRYNIKQSDIQILLERVPNNISTFVRDNYESRFTEEEAKILDYIKSNMDEIIDNNVIYAITMSSVINYVMDRCFVGGRLNKGQVLANINHRIKHVRNSGSSMKFYIQPLHVEIYGRDDCIALNMDAIELLKNYTNNTNINADMIYIDPPYGGSQSDYSFMYKFSEEYVCSKTLNNIKHLKYANRFVSNKNYDENFRDLISLLPKNSHWVFSYNESSWASIDAIKEIIFEYRSDIIVKNIDYSYNYRKDRSNSKEYVIVCKK